MKDLKSIIEKYNVAAPRYTSYPTVPFWDVVEFSEAGWAASISKMKAQEGQSGVGLYVHLPFCESLCTYCGCNTRITKNHAVEDPYISSVLKEWELYKNLLGEEKPVITDLHLGGGTPTFFSHDNLQRLISGLLGGNQPVSGTSFSFEAHPANTTFEHLETLYNLGFRRLSLGIQDFDERVQEIINRKQTVEDVQRVIDQAREIGYTSINFDLIYGLPLQTEATIIKTIELALGMAPDRISFYSYAHVPWLKPSQRMFTEADLPVGAEKLQLYLLGKSLIQKAGYEDVGMDHFALATDDLVIASKTQRLHRNFMGYTDRYIPLLIGLGVSSISDSWYGFAQNVKTVEEYHARLNNNELPLLKGHLLSSVDLKIRRQILDVMCKGKTILYKDDEHFSKIIQGLMPMVEDQFILLENQASLNGYILTVTDVGKQFLRNICMAFDLKLLENKNIKAKFSQAV